MSMIRAIIRTGFALASVGILCGAATAQEKSPQTAPPTGQQENRRPDGPGRREGMRGRGQRDDFGPMMGMRQLNLSETQRQQMRDTFTKFRDGIKPQQEELRQIRQKFDQATATIEDQTRAQALRKQIGEAHQRAMAEAQAVLTPEQQEQMRQMREQMKQRHEQMKQRRGAGRGQEAPPPQNQ